MCWFLYLFFAAWVIVSWVLYHYAPNRTSQLFQRIVKKNETILFVIAHPDDECMFFGPAIVFLTKSVGEKRARKSSTFILCLSDGNYDGLGSVRRNELLESCRILGVPERNVFLHGGFDDNPVMNWDPKLISDVVASYTRRLKFSHVFTFDGYGVSGHANHKAVYQGICEYARQYHGINCYTLDSVNILRKYSGFLDWIATYFSRDYVVVANADRLLIQSAMKAHTSQLLWFRKLYIKLSRYMYFNTYKRIE